jgi:outer membrane protein
MRGKKTKREELTRVRAWLTIIAMLLFLGSVTAEAQEQVYTLRDAYTSALKTHESIKIAEEGVLQSESVIDQARTYLYPRLNGNAGYTRYNEILPPPPPVPSANSVIFQPQEESTASLKLTQPLYTGGRTLAALRTAKSRQEASRQDLAASREDLMLGVAEAFYGVLKAQKLVDVSRESVERMERNRKVTEREANIRRTKANASALLRANTLVSQARIILLRSEDGLRIARRKLGLITGLPENASLTEPATLEAPAEGYDRLRDFAVARREDYAKARLDRDVARENIAIVKGAHLPQLSAEGGVRYKSAAPSTLDEGTTNYVGLRLEVPIFEGGLMRHEVSEARSKLRQSELFADLLRRNIESEVYEASINLQTETSVLSAVKQQYDDAKSNFTAVEALFAEGVASTLQLIDAQQALLFTEREYVNAIYDQQVAILRLQRAVGMLGKA